MTQRFGAGQGAVVAFAARACTRMWTLVAVCGVALMCSAHLGAQGAASSSNGGAAQQTPTADTETPPAILLPEVTTFVQPVYPPEAVAARVTGTVIVGVAIDAEGRIQNAAIAQSVPMLDEAALEAVRQWTFTPPMVDGRPAPTGINVAFEFVLGPLGDAPTPSVPDPRPSWIPPDFAFEYRLSCQRGSAVIDMQGYTVDGTRIPLQFGIQDIQAIYLRMFAAGAFADDAPTLRLQPGVRTAPGGFRLQVAADLPLPERPADAPSDAHVQVLDVRYYGAWRRVDWHEPDYDRRPESHDQLETIGQLIRERVARQPPVMALPREQRACLPES